MNPESGSSTIDNLGDVSKLDSFMSSLDGGGQSKAELMDENDNTPASQPMGETTTGEAEEYVESDSQPAPQPRKPNAEEGQGQEGLLDGKSLSGALNEQGVITPTKGARDYADIDPSDVPLFKGMSNEAYAKARDWYKAARNQDTKYKELEGTYSKVKDLQYYQHPEAYRLTEDYSKLEKSVSNSNTLANHWQQQLALIKEGKPFHDVVVGENGELSLGGQYQPSPQAEALVTRALQKSTMDASQAQAKLEAYKGDYSARHKNFDTTLGKIEQDLLGEVRTNPEFVKLEQQVLNSMIPPELRGSRQYQLMAGMGAFIQAMAKEINKLKAQVAGKNKLANVIKNQGPGEGAPATNSATTSDNPEDVIKGLMKHVGRA